MAQEGSPISDFLSAYSIQSWLESRPQRYLVGAEYGHAPSETEPATLLEKVDKKNFVASVVGQNIVPEGLAFSVFEIQYAVNMDMIPKFAHTLSGTIADGWTGATWRRSSACAARGRRCGCR